MDKKTKSFHKNIYLKNYKGLDRYIANDFKKMGLTPKDTADYISWLDSNITQRPLFYITNVFLNTINDLLKKENNNIIIKIKNNEFKIDRREERTSQNLENEEWFPECLDTIEERPTSASCYENDSKD